MLPTPSSTQRRSLVWMVFGLLALVILASGLNGITFQPGKMYRMPTLEAGLDVGESAVGSAEPILTFLRWAVALMLVMVVLTVIISLLTKKGRRMLLIELAIGIVLALFLSQVQQPKPLERKDNPLEAAPPPKELAVGDPLPLPPVPSDAFVVIASIGLAAAGLGFAAWYGRRILFPRQPLPPLAKIELEANRARATLVGGGGVEDAIVRAYRQMGRAVAEGRRLTRSQTMTAHEFEEYLSTAGLPREPVQVLTRLFEDVRYGGLVAGADERQAAIASLDAIAAACRKDKK